MEITLVVWGLSQENRSEIYSASADIDENPPLSVLDAERDYLTAEEKREIESSLVEI